LLPETTRTPLVGREALVEDLLSAARRATGMSIPTVRTVLGDPGIGKSELARALTEKFRNELPRADVLSICAPEPMEDNSDELLRLLLRQCLAIGSSEVSLEDVKCAVSGRAPAAGNDAWIPVALALGVPLSLDNPGVRRLAAAPGVLRAGI